MIRITGGKNRSRKLLTPDTNLTKPTMDKVRAAVFNALGDDIVNKRILDLFSGSGSYGFEALSRGASSVTFVDKQIDAVKVIKANAASLNENNVRIFNEDVLNFLSEKNGEFDIVFVDPPYKLDIYEKVLDLLEKNEYLSNNAIIVLEADNDIALDEEKYKKIKQYRYGLTKIYIMRK